MEFNDDSVDERAATLREVRILKLVGGHPNIIDIFASFETPNYVFIVMELCPYGELFDYLTKVVRLSGEIFECFFFLIKILISRKTYSSNNVEYISWC
jgi:serine/threonine protein kinase